MSRKYGRWMFLVLCLSVAGCGINSNPGTGEKVGQVVKLSKEGLFCKTWEGQLIRGGLTDGSGALGAAPFEFTVESRELATQLQQYMRNQTEVIVTYRMEGVYSLCRTNNAGVFLESIAPAAVVSR